MSKEDNWEFEFKWLEVRHKVKANLKVDDLPDLKTILVLIGIQEYGRVHEEFTKEEKQDLMHVAVCSLLEPDGYYLFTGKDADGWPHWEQGKALKIKGKDQQEKLLMEKIVSYFENLDV